MTEPAEPRVNPCASCPYRKSVPSGIWDASEYQRLPEYDREMHEQPVNAFGCHQADGTVCAGWLGHRDPAGLLAVRVGVVAGVLSEACLSYTTIVPLHESGLAAAEHGLRDIAAPSVQAAEMISKLVRTKGTR